MAIDRARHLSWSGCPEHTGRFLDFIDGERLYALFHLVAFTGLRRSEAIWLSWAEVDLGQGLIYIRETRADDEDDPDDPKSQSGDRTVPLDAVTITVLRDWRKTQTQERLAWGQAWADSGLVFTREDGTALSPQWVSIRFEALAYRCGLPPIRFHDLRHGAASLSKAAGQDTKIISELLGRTAPASPTTSISTCFQTLPRQRRRQERPSCRGDPKPDEDHAAGGHWVAAFTGTGRP